MNVRCPGQDSRNISVERVKCPGCGYKLELFSDEAKGICPRCRKAVHKKRLPSCVQWCASARECIGEEKWKELKKGE